MFDGTASHIQRFAWREPLIARLAELLAHGGCEDIHSRARRMAARLEHAGAHAGTIWMYRRESPEGQAERRQMERWRQDGIVRTHLVTGAFERNYKKLGKTEATRRALQHWDRQLLVKGRIAIRVPPPRYPRLEEVVADALIWTLEAELGRSLHKPHTKAAEREIAVLTEAFDLVVRVAKVPNLVSGKKVRRPGTARWFTSRIATHARTSAAR